MSEHQLAEKTLKLCSELRSAQEALEKNNKEEFTKLANVSADTLTEINTLKSAMKKRDEVIKELELQIANAPSNITVLRKSSDDYREMLDSYLRKGSKRNWDYGFDMEIATKALDWAFTHTKALPIFINKESKISMRKDMVEGINPQGGYWVLPEYSSRDVTKFFETNPLRQMANVMTCGTSELKMIIDDNTSQSGGWVGEQEARSTTETARIGELSIPIHEIYAEPKATHWMLEDVNFDLVSWITNKTIQITNLYENSAFLQGNGSKKARGILNYPAWGGEAVAFGNDSNYERNALEHIYTGTAGVLTYDSLINVQNSLLEQYQANAQWLMTRSTWSVILQLKDDQNRPLYNLNNLLQTGADKVLLGQEVRIAAPTQTVQEGTTTGSLPGMPQVVTGGTDPVTGVIIYGDFREGYGIVDRLGFTTIVDILTEKQYVKYYTRKRVGGALTSYQSLKVLDAIVAP
jgi:HK97 family phage major capsid protein